MLPASPALNLHKVSENRQQEALSQLPHPYHKGQFNSHPGLIYYSLWNLASFGGVCLLGHLSDNKLFSRPIRRTPDKKTQNGDIFQFFRKSRLWKLKAGGEILDKNTRGSTQLIRFSDHSSICSTF